MEINSATTLSLGCPGWSINFGSISFKLGRRFHESYEGTAEKAVTKWPASGQPRGTGRWSISECLCHLNVANGLDVPLEDTQFNWRPSPGRATRPVGREDCLRLFRGEELEGGIQ